MQESFGTDFKEILLHSKTYWENGNWTSLLKHDYNFIFILSSFTFLCLISVTLFHKKQIHTCTIFTILQNTEYKFDFLSVWYNKFNISYETSLHIKTSLHMKSYIRSEYERVTAILIITIHVCVCINRNVKHIFFGKVKFRSLKGRSEGFGIGRAL